MSYEQVQALKRNAENLAELHGHTLTPWTDSPFPNIGSLAFCIRCGREVHASEAGTYGMPLDEDCPARKV
jgi:hypothetical protein